MILYNVTVSIDPTIHEDWLGWMRSVHIPQVMETGCFVESRISRIRSEEPDEVSFSIMYLCPSQELLDEYQSIHAPLLQQDHSTRYQGKFAAFRTTLSVIEEYKKA